MPEALSALFLTALAIATSTATSTTSNATVAIEIPPLFPPRAAVDPIAPPSAAAQYDPTLRVGPSVPRAVYADGRDHWSLLPPGLMNRELKRQIAGERHRWLADAGPVSAALETTLGYQQWVGQTPQTRFHGYFVLDGYVQLRPLDALDVNLGVALFNPSASDGYRVSADILHGLSVHWHPSLGVVAGERLHLDVLAVDLDTVTLGAGLLIERLPSEGIMGGLRWGIFEVRATGLGRALAVFWPLDPRRDLYRLKWVN